MVVRKLHFGFVVSVVGATAILVISEPLARSALPPPTSCCVSRRSTIHYPAPLHLRGVTCALPLASWQVADGFCPRYKTSHGQLLVVRGVERCLAEFGLVWSTARLLEASAPAETKKDFVFHLRALLEHAPARDRHQVSEGRASRVSATPLQCGSMPLQCGSMPLQCGGMSLQGGSMPL